MSYATPAIEGRQPIADSFVLGILYNPSPSWTDQSDTENQETA